MTLHNILDALVRLSITSIPSLQSQVPSAIVRVLVIVTTGRPLYYADAFLRNRFLPATATVRQLGVNAQTIRNRLRQNNIPIRAHRPYTGPILTGRHRAARLLWAQRHLHWTRRQWYNVIFSAKSRFT